MLTSGVQAISNRASPPGPLQARTTPWQSHCGPTSPVQIRGNAALLSRISPCLCGQCVEVATDTFVRRVDRTRHAVIRHLGAVRLLRTEAWDGILKVSLEFHCAVIKHCAINPLCSVILTIYILYRDNGRRWLWSFQRCLATCSCSSPETLYLAGNYLGLILWGPSWLQYC